MRKLSLILLLPILLSTSAFAANYGIISGLVRSAATGAELTNAWVGLEDSTVRTSPDFMGRYYIIDLDPGIYKVRAGAPGYKEQSKTVEVLKGQTAILNFELEPAPRSSVTFGGTGDVENIPPNTSRIDQIDPLSESTTGLPTALMRFPGVFVRERGNQYAYPELFYRGMSGLPAYINGMKQNDLFSSTCFINNIPWLMALSNELSITPGAATQMPGGYPTTGEINILPLQAREKASIEAGQFYGNGTTLNTVLKANTGRLGGFSLQTVFVNSVSDGFPDKLWNKSITFYSGMAYEWGNKHRLELNFFGLFKYHANRKTAMDMECWDTTFAADNGVHQPAMRSYKSKNIGYDNYFEWGNTNFTSKNYYWGKERETQYSNFMNHSELYSNTPAGILSWDWKLSDALTLSNKFNFSVVSGGTASTCNWDDQSFDLDVVMNFDSLFIHNSSDDRIDPDNPSAGRKVTYFMQNIAQNDIYYGWKGLLSLKISDTYTAFLRLNVNVQDMERFREVRNLLGGDYMIDQRGSNGQYEYICRIGDKFGYYYEGKVIEYSAGTGINYNSGDFSWNMLCNLGLDNYSKESKFESDYYSHNETGMYIFNISGRCRYRLDEELSLFAGAGFQSAPPAYEAVYNIDNSNNDWDYARGMDFDLGAEYRNNHFRAYCNIYYNKLLDYSTIDYFTYHYNIAKFRYLAISSERYGVEAFLEYKPNDLLDFTASADFSGSQLLGRADWCFEDISGTSFFERQKGSYDADGVKAFGAPHTSFSVAGTLHPWNSSFLTLILNYYDGIYSDIIFFNLSDKRLKDSWEIPGYFIMNLNAGFDIPVSDLLQIKVFADVYNLLDTKYISLAYNGVSYDQETALVLFGIPLRWDLGVKIGF